MAQKAISFLWVGQFLFSGGLGKFFFSVYFSSGFQIIGLSSLALHFQFAFLPLSKVLVNCGLRVFNVFFGQVTLAKLASLALSIFGKVRFQNQRISVGRKF